MSKATSLLLDLLRVLAALAVLASHCNWAWYPDWGIFRWWGHEAVIVFFILSGYVIAFVTHNRETNPKRYIIARLSRLCSVVLPALLLTAVLQIIGLHLYPTFYESHTRKLDVLHYIFTGLYLQSIWGLNACPATNNPFWSLGYEFWYYVVFGVIIFSKSWKAKIASFLMIGLITGMNIWLLAPLWFYGVAIYVYRHSIRMTRSAALIGLVLTLGTTVLCLIYVPNYPERMPGLKPLYYSGVYIRDCLIGLFLAGFIWFFEQAFHSLSIGNRIEKIIRWAASHTFSLYLYHYPLLFFLTATGIFGADKPWLLLLEFILILVLILILGTLTESKRELWSHALNKLWPS